MQLFPEKLENVWNEWEIRVLILISLILQVILIIFGARRKFTASVNVRILVWSAYLIADPVATIALGNLARSQVDCEDKSSELNNVLQAFWAPFLLLHLGGPDTITAYSLEDNELWLRHLLGLIVQVGVAIYVFIRSWSDTALTFIGIPMFITGIIKYGERTFVLRSSSMDHFRDSLQSSPVPDQVNERIDPQANYLLQASLLFKRSAYLYANLILDFHGQIDPSYCMVHDKSAEDVFKLVETELGFMYDVLFTKAAIVYSGFGIFLRVISFFSSVSALIVFSIIIEIHAHPIADIYLTYSLLVAAVFLEIYAFVLFLLSDRAKIWLIKLNAEESRVARPFHSEIVNKPSKRWSSSIGQYNLVGSWLEYKSATFIGALFSKLVGKKYLYFTWESMTIDLQNMIFKQIQDNSNEFLNNLIDQRQSLKQILDRRGDYVLEKRYSLDGFRWSTIEVDFDHSLLVWHIATDLCYYGNLKIAEGDHESKLKREISKHLSNYMLYLLVFCPSMLHKGISYEIRYKDTYNSVKKILKQTYYGYESGRQQLLQHLKDDQEAVDNNMSVLHHGCRLANNLQALEAQWKMISEVWIEMLIYAANHCSWKEHGQQLGKGGELLTHVSLVMAHFGLSEQYRMEGDMVVPDTEWSDLF